MQASYQSHGFESLVNTEGFQTGTASFTPTFLFESLVNTEGFQTVKEPVEAVWEFESLVNTEGFQTQSLKHSVQL